MGLSPMIVQPSEKVVYLKLPERRQGADEGQLEKINRLRPQAVNVIKSFLRALPKG